MKTNASASSKRALTGAVILLLPALAQAHPGPPGHTRGFVNGLIHPLTGLDHFCAMVAVGLWAAQRGGHALWLLPLSFVSLMIVGGASGMGGAPLPFIEQGVAASVLVLGLLIAGAVRLPLAAGALLAGAFALFHGYAHGAEMPNTASGLAYGSASSRRRRNCTCWGSARDCSRKNSLRNDGFGLRAARWRRAASTFACRCEDAGGKTGGR